MLFLCLSPSRSELLTRCSQYAWSAAGYLLISIPVMFKKTRNVGVQTKEPEPTIPDTMTMTDAVAKRTESRCFANNPLATIQHADPGLYDQITSPTAVSSSP